MSRNAWCVFTELKEMLVFVPERRDSTLGKCEKPSISPHSCYSHNIHYFHNDKKQQIPSENLQEHQYLEQKDLQYLTHLCSLGESSPLGKIMEK